MRKYEPNPAASCGVSGWVLCKVSAPLTYFVCAFIPAASSGVFGEANKKRRARHKGRAQRHKRLCCLFMVVCLSMIRLTIRPACASDWLNFLGDNTHAAFTSEQIVTPLTLKWKSFANGGIVSSPVKYKEKIFVGSRDKNIYAFNAYTGALLWNYQTQGWVDSTPSVSSSTGTVYVGSYDGALYALNESTGALKWKYTTSANISSSALAYNGKVYFGTIQAGNNKLIALDEATGALSFQVSMPQPVYSSPAADSGKIYVGCNDGKLYVLDANTGSSIWTFSSNNGQMYFSSPTISSGMVFVAPGYYDANFYALDAATGTVKWAYNTGAASFTYVSSQAVSSTMIYFASGYPNATLYALDKATGTLKWSKSLGAVTDHGFLSTPAVSNNVVYVGTGTSTLYALDAQTGNVLANVALDKPVLSSIVATNGMVYVATTQGSVYAYFGQDAQLPTVALTSPKDNSFVSKNVVFSGSAADTNLEYYTLDYKEDGMPDWVAPELVKSYAGVNNSTLYTWDTTALIENQKYNVRLTASDVAGNTQSTQITVTIDRIPPALTVSSPQNNFSTNVKTLTTTGSTELGATFTINNQNVALDAQGKFTKDITLSEGINTITYSSTDAAGNQTTAARTVTLDTTPPVLSVSSPVDNLLTNVQTLTVSGNTEAGAKLLINGASVPVNAQGNFSTTLTLAKGTNTVTVSSSDSLNNTTTLSRTVTYDPDAPPITVTSPSDNLVTNQAKLTVSGQTETGAKVTVNNTSVTVDSNGNFTTTLTLTEGKNTITIISEDKAGNKMTAARTVTLDTIAPSITVSSPVDNLITNKKTLTASGSAEVGSTLKINTVDVPVDAKGNFTKDITLSEGDNVITFVAMDSAQNTQTVTRKVILDTQPPTGTLALNPVSAYTDKKDVSLSLSAQDNQGGTGVKDMTLSEDGTFTASAWEAYQTARTFSLSPAYGVKKIYCKFRDAAGNESAVVSASIEYVMFISPVSTASTGITLGDDKIIKITLQNIDAGGALQLVLSEGQVTSPPQKSIGKAMKLRFVYTPPSAKASGAPSGVKTMVTLVFPYANYKASVQNESDLKMYYALAGGELKLLPGFQQVDTASQTVTASSPLLFNVDYTLMLVESPAAAGTAGSLKVFNYPNPAHGDTTFSYALSEGIPVRVTIDVFTITGKKVLFLEDPTPQDGKYTTAEIDSLPNGIYVYRMVVTTAAKAFSTTGRFVLLK